MCYNVFSRIRENAGFRTVLSAGREYRILTRPDCHFDNPAFCRMRAVSCKCRNICFILQARWPQERHGGLAVRDWKEENSVSLRLCVQRETKL